MISKKHFIKFAEIAKRHIDNGDIDWARTVFNAVCEVNDNPLFNKEKFKTACGL
jgi:hypothetical protein